MNEKILEISSVDWSVWNPHFPGTYLRSFNRLMGGAGGWGWHKEKGPSEGGGHSGDTALVHNFTSHCACS